MLHVAVSQGSVASVNVLVADSRINLRAENKKLVFPRCWWCLLFVMEVLGDFNEYRSYSAN